MEKKKKDQSPENSESIQDPVTSTNRIIQGRANPNFPQEYEEQLSDDIRMIPQPLEAEKKTTAGQVRIGIAADHGGFKLKEFLVKMLLEVNYEIIDFGNSELKNYVDYSDFEIPWQKQQEMAAWNVALLFAAAEMESVWQQTKLMESGVAYQKKFFGTSGS